ncbi:hypothetical protein Pst134EA_003062 [Puccinia striiformis f. sp. tritici]|nr:hypothetical protein Pst134EA_003062 [Puccinia striiformis f. sp. tritici]KAH9472448.1 hypothetical protein Pst134EA_003062 [Puccinia striiformis f. sp. tritici]
MKDVSQYMKAVIKLVKQIAGEQSESVTIVHIVDVFRGSKGKKITNAGHDQLDGAGQGSTLDRTDSERLLHLMVSKDILTERFEANAMGFTNAYVQLGPAHRSVLNSKEPVMMAFNGGSGPTKRTTGSTEAPKKVTIKQKANGKEISIVDDSDEDYIVDESIDCDSHPRASRSTRTPNGPPVRGAAKQKALASIKAKRQLIDLQSAGGNSVEDCYKALLLVKDTSTSDDDSDVEFPDNEVLQTIACIHPQSIQALSAVDGLSKRCLDKYGSTILKVLNKFKTQEQNKQAPRTNGNSRQENKSTNSTTNRPVDFHQHVSKYVASTTKETTKSNPATTTNNFKKFVPRNNGGNNAGGGGTSSAAIKPMPIPR